MKLHEDQIRYLVEKPIVSEDGALDVEKIP